MSSRCFFVVKILLEKHSTKWYFNKRKYMHIKMISLWNSWSSCHLSLAYVRSCASTLDGKSSAHHKSYQKSCFFFVPIPLPLVCCLHLFQFKFFLIKAIAYLQRIDTHILANNSVHTLFCFLLLLLIFHTRVSTKELCALDKLI